MTIYAITPVPKPRMTQRDKWAKRPAVLRYRAFCDEVRLKGVEIPESGSHIKFGIPMPKSWSKKKRREMLLMPHRQKPDIDNLTKALLDAVHKDDSGVWDLRTSKFWGTEGWIAVESPLDELAAQAQELDIGY